MLFNRKEKEKSKGLNIIIVGCGEVGTALVEQLSGEGHDITVIDENRERVQELTNMYDIMGVCGNGASFNVQKEAGIKDADLIIAVTKSDELNLLCCTVGRKVDSCAAIARVRNPDYLHDREYLLEKLDLAMIINPEQEAAREISRILLIPSALEVNSFAHSKAELVKIRIPEGNVMDGMTVADFGKKTDGDTVICAVERKKQITIPNGDFELKAGDIISFVSPRKRTGEMLQRIGFKSDKVRDAIIIGGGSTAYYLARLLEHDGIGCKIVERDRARCEELCSILPKSTIICGDATDEDLLKEEGIENTEAVVSLTGNDEENILLSLYANQLGNAKVITQINRAGFSNVIDNLDLGAVVFPKYITTEAIIAYVRAKTASQGSNVEALFHMFDHRVEAVEFKVESESKVTGTPLMDLNLKDNLIVCVIYRRGKAIIPSGHDCILPGDTVSIVTTHTGFSTITDILG